MKKFILTFLCLVGLLPVPAARAAAPVDGIYGCTLFAPTEGGRMTGGAFYMPVFTNAAGQTLITFAAAGTGEGAGGYGIGTLTGKQFQGTSNVGHNFALDLNESYTTMNGSIGFMSPIGPLVYDMKCNKVW